MHTAPAKITFLAASYLVLTTLTILAAPLVFEGRLIPPADQPAEYYTVCLEHHEGPRQTPPSEFRITQQPDADGAFRMEAPPHREQYWLFIEDQAGRVLIGYPHLNASRDFGSIELRNDGELMGVLHTPDNEPAADVRVRIERKLEARCSHYVTAGTIHSDAQGTFAFAQMHPGEYRLRIESEQYTHAATDVTITEDINYLELQLQPAASIRGRVTRPDGSPVAGVSVQTRGRTAPATTDAEGHYHIGGLGPDTYRLQVRGDDLATKNFATLAITLAHEDVTAPDIVVMPLGTLRVTLTPSAPGKPLPESLAIALEAQDERHSRFPFEAPVQESVAVFEGLAPGDFVLRLRDETLGDIQNEVTITSSIITELTVELPEVLEIVGTVSEADGTPVTGARVSARAIPTSATRSHTSRQARTDTEGSFRIRGVPQDGTYNITIYDAERYEELTALSDVPAGSDELMIILAPKHTIPLRVLTADGSPIADAAVTMTSAGRHHWMRSPGDADRTTDGDGATTIEARGGSRYTINVRAPSWVEASQTLDLSEGRDAPESIEIRMRAGITVSGTVVDSGGISRPGAYISAEGHDAIQTDAQGAFEISGVGPGVLVLYVHADPEHQQPLAMQRVLIEDAATSAPPVQIVLPAPGSIRGMLHDAEGNPLPETMVMLHNMMEGFSSHMTPYQTQTDSDAAFVFESVIPGSYMLMAVSTDGGYGMTSGNMPPMRMIEIQAGKETVANLPEVVAAGKTISGRITQNGNPLPETQVILMPLGEDGTLNMLAMMALMNRKPILTDAEGRYTAPNLQPGQYLAIIARDGEDHPFASQGMQHAVPVSIAEGQSECDISIDSITLRGIVISSDGEPAANIQVTVAPAAVDSMIQEIISRTTETDQDGHFEIPDLTAGRFRITIIDDARAEAVTQTLELGADTTLAHAIQLAPGQRIEGRIRREPEGPIEQAFVMVFSPDGSPMGADSIDEDGSFALENVLPQGRYFVACLHQELVAPGQFVEAGANNPLAFVLKPGGDVTVTLTGDHEQIANRTLHIIDTDGNTIQRITSTFDMGYMASMTRSLSLLPTDENGQTTVYGLPAGTYTMGLVDHAVQTTVTVLPFAQTSIELSLE